MTALTDFPAFVAANAKLQEIYERQADAENEAQQLEAKIGESAAGKPATDASMLAAARRLGLNSAELDLAEMREQLRKAKQTVAECRALAELQKKEVEREHSKASEAINKEVEPAHRALVAKLAESLVETARIGDCESALRDRLTNAGVSITSVIRAMPVNPVGSLRDRNSFVCGYIRECIDYGFLTGKEGFLSDVEYK